MERVHLSKKEKVVFRLISARGTHPASMSDNEFAACVRSLERRGFVRVMYDEGDAVITARLTVDGQSYLAENPGLKNPVDWKYISTITVSLIAAAASVLALFISCTLMSNK